MAAKIWEQHFTAANGKALTIPKGKSEGFFVLPFVHEMELTKIVCKPVAGTELTSFTLELFNAPAAGVYELAGEKIEPTTDPDIARVCMPYDSVKGLIALFAADRNGAGWLFHNMEGGQANNRRRIFVKITTEGQKGDAVFELALAGEMLLPY